MIWIIISVVVLVLIVLVGFTKQSSPAPSRVPGPLYVYTRKDYVMTVTEAKFFQRLVELAKDRYYVFPQVHLASLLDNKTVGRYRKLAFQRINRRSVDYVLCDKETMKTAYAIELDDRTHNSETRRARDRIVDEMLTNAHIPLVRLRDVSMISDAQIIDKLQQARAQST